MMQHMQRLNHHNNNNNSIIDYNDNDDDGLYNSKYRNEILYSIEQNSVVLLVGNNHNTDHAATQVPLYLYDNGYCGDRHNGNSTETTSSSILITQPNANHTIACAKRTIEVLQRRRRRRQQSNRMVDTDEGDNQNNNTDRYNEDDDDDDDPTSIVGYTVPFQQSSSNKYQNNNQHHHHNKIRYVTHDGLIQDIVNGDEDPLLMRYNAVIVHHGQQQHVTTTTTTTDIVLGVLRKIRHHRNETTTTTTTGSSNRLLRIVILVGTHNDTATHEQGKLLLQYFVGKKQALRVLEESSSSSSMNANTVVANSNNDDENKIAVAWNQTGMILSIYDHPIFPVSIQYCSEPTANYMTLMIETVAQIITNTSSSIGDGDILCFVPSYSDVMTAIQLSQEYLDQLPQYNSDTTGSRSKKRQQQPNVDCLPFSTTLPYHIQEQILHPAPPPPLRSHGQQERRRRRVIFTNLNVETTCIAIPNIQFVIDSGYMDIPCYFDPIAGLNRSYESIPISQQHAQQRTSYASTMQAAVATTSSNAPSVKSTFVVGQCFRLYTEQYMTDKMIQSTPPAITRTDMTYTILLLKSIGIDNIFTFDFGNDTLPSIDSIRYGLEALYGLGAIDDTTTMTPMGYEMIQLAVEPRMARMIVESIRCNCTWEIITIASVMHVATSTSDLDQHDQYLLQTKPKRQQQRIVDYDDAMSNVADSTGDHLSYLNVFSDIDQQYNIDYNYCSEHFLQYNTVRQCLEVRKHLARLVQRLRRRRSTDKTTDPAGVFGEINNNKRNAVFDDDRSPMIRRCITTGYFMNVAKLQNDGQYYTIRNNDLMVVPSKYSFYTSHSKMSSEYIVFCHSGGSTGDRRSVGVEIQHVSSIEAKWLREIAPYYFE